MKNLKLFIATMFTMGLSVGVVYAADAMPKAVNGTITLNENITLNTAYNLSDDVKVIDLNGKTITADNVTAIVNNNANLTIKNGNIVCNGEAECITNNNGSVLTIEGVTIDADKSAVVCSGDTNILNSTIKSDTNVIHGKVSGGKTVTVNVENSTLEGSKVVYNNITGGESNFFVNINGGELKGGYKNHARQVITISGNIKMPYNYLSDKIKYNEGTKVTLNAWEDKQNIIVPEGVTLSIPESVNLKYDTDSKYHMIVNGMVEGNVNANVYDEYTKSYFGSIKKAMVAAKKESYIKVLKDYTEPDGLSFVAQTGSGNKHTENDIVSFIVDLNGHKVTSSTTSVDENISLKLEDNSEAGNGTIVGTVTNNGNVELAGGSYTSLPTGSGILTISGGTYPKALLTTQKLPEGKKLVENEDGTVSVISVLADYTKLDEALAKAAELDLTKYTDETVAVLADAIKAADAVDRKLPIADQAKVDALTKALNDAIAGLKEVTAESGNPENPNTLDSLPLYLVGGAVAVLGVAGLGYSIKKKFEN